MKRIIAALATAGTIAGCNGGTEVSHLTIGDGGRIAVTIPVTENSATETQYKSHLKDLQAELDSLCKDVFHASTFKVSRLQNSTLANAGQSNERGLRGNDIEMWIEKAIELVKLSKGAREILRNRALTIEGSCVGIAS